MHAADDFCVERQDNEKNLEFVELLNITDHAIDLAGWQLAGGINLSFVGRTDILPGAPLVVVGFVAVLGGIAMLRGRGAKGGE